MHSPSNPFLQETLVRELNALRVLPYGIGFLDDALDGILPSELVIIAGRTGVGKTELGISLAINAAKAGLVWLMALEAEPTEVHRRIKYQFIASRFFKDRSAFSPSLHLNYSGWACGQFADELKELDALANLRLPEEFKNLYVHQPGKAKYEKGHFEKSYEMAVRAGAKLVVLDHIHYISPDYRESEYDHVRETMWRIRDLINKHEVPVIAFSHLHKESKLDKNWVPTLDDLHGSSEISKQANQVISLAPCYALPSKNLVDGKPKMITQPAGSTLCRILKSRRGQIAADRYVALMQFDLNERIYLPKYVPYGTDRFSSSLQYLKYEDFERWMGRGVESAI